MRIKLHFPEQSIATISAMGLRQKSPETLRLVTDHPDSRYGPGVILRSKSGEQLGAKHFAALNSAFGAWIECDSAKTMQRVRNALYTVVTGMDEHVKVAQ
jgi:hypothetical protein